MPSIFNTVSMVNGKLVQFDDMLIKYGSTDDKPTPTPVDPLNPLGLPPFTIRCKFTQGVTPEPGEYADGSKVVWDKLTCVDEAENIWDITKNSTDWTLLLGSDDWQSTDINVIQVLGANTTGVTIMRQLVQNTHELTSISIFDTSAVTDFSYMFYCCNNLDIIPCYNMDSAIDLYGFVASSGIRVLPEINTHTVKDMGSMFSDCLALSRVPLLDTTSVENVTEMFENCHAVESGALALYNQLVQQHGDTIFHDGTFNGCGWDTDNGKAELQQIPKSWGGLKPDESDDDEDEDP